MGLFKRKCDSFKKKYIYNAWIKLKLDEKYVLVLDLENQVLWQIHWNQVQYLKIKCGWSHYHQPAISVVCETQHWDRPKITKDGPLVAQMTQDGIFTQYYIGKETLDCHKKIIGKYRYCSVKLIKIWLCWPVVTTEITPYNNI